MSYWKKLTDEQLLEELERNKKLFRKINPQERAIAHKNVEEIVAEQTRRYEERWLREL